MTEQEFVETQAATVGQREPDFEFNLTDTVGLKDTALKGRIIARTQYETAENQYLVDYSHPQGLHSGRDWWPESSILIPSVENFDAA